MRRGGVTPRAQVTGCRAPRRGRAPVTAAAVTAGASEAGAANSDADATALMGRAPVRRGSGSRGPSGTIGGAESEPDPERLKQRSRGIALLPPRQLRAMEGFRAPGRRGAPPRYRSRWSRYRSYLLAVSSDIGMIRRGRLRPARSPPRPTQLRGLGTYSIDIAGHDIDHIS